jgi:hypothetical protein
MSNSIGTHFSSVGSNRSSHFIGGGLSQMQLLQPGVAAVPILVAGEPYMGGALKGKIAPSLLLNDQTSGAERTRLTIREVFNTTEYSGSSNKLNMAGNFRAVMNAGDLLSRQNYSCGGTCNTVQSRPNMHGLKQHLGHVSKNCMPSVVWSLLQLDDRVPAANCNVKYVYDSSDYTKFKRQQAILKNYNAMSNGGDMYNGAQSAIRHIRRY